jgi:hypothetical protein
VLYGAVGVVVLMIAGAGKLLGGAASALIWVTLMARGRRHHRRLDGRTAEAARPRPPPGTAAIPPAFGHISAPPRAARPRFAP